MTTWTYEGYWNVVLGDKRDAARVVGEFQLDPTNRRGLDEWLGGAEATAWSEGGDEHDMPAEWRDFHGKALGELCAVTP